MIERSASISPIDVRRQILAETQPILAAVVGLRREVERLDRLTDQLAANQAGDTTELRDTIAQLEAVTMRNAAVLDALTDGVSNLRQGDRGVTEAHGCGGGELENVNLET